MTPPGPAHKKGLEYFFATTVWELDPYSYRGIRRYGVKYLQIMTLMARNFWADQCQLRASALTFTSILSLVPFLALAFAVLKGLGVQNKLEPYILQQVAAGSKPIVDRIITYINNTNVTSLGAIGLVTLIVTVITLLGSIEEAFNIIWGVKETRPLTRKFSDYLSVLLSAPLLVVAAMSVSASLSSQAVVQWVITNTYLGTALLFAIRFFQHFSIWAALVFLYIFIPNTKVHLKSAVIGGVLAGTFWQIAQWGYVNFQVGAAKYNAIYGTLAVLPIFMVWVYTSWLIVLLGVELVCAHQNIRTFRREHRISVSHELKEILALSILQNITESFCYGKPPFTIEALAEKLDIPVRVVRELLDMLEEAGFVVEVAGEIPAYQPAREVESISVQDVLKTVRSFGGAYRLTTVTLGERQVMEMLTKREEAAAAVLAGVSLRQLIADGMGGETAKEGGKAQVAEVDSHR